MPIEIAKEIKNLIPVFEKYPEVKLVYLFGSRVTGKIGPLSDHDFAIYLDEKDAKKRFELKLNIISEITKSLKTDSVDLVVLNDIDAPEMKYNVIKDGTLILQVEPFKVIVEPRILNEYFDFHSLLLRHNLTKA
ncbi:MAG: nucleotidyltransferase domain-containing protein [Patescibacteria group bacterium]